jgi:uncharacterized protein YgfB (UPF0149 family)
MEGLLEEDNLPTPDDERELVERAAKAIADADTFMYPIGTKCPHVAQARAAIAVVLEEAAKVADEMVAEVEIDEDDFGGDWDDIVEGQADVARVIAGRIRALNPKER